MGPGPKIRRPTERLSARLLTRHLTLSLGHTPDPDTIRAHQVRLISEGHVTTPAFVASKLPPIYEDIQLERVESSQDSLEMAEDARVSQIELNVNELKTDVTEVKTDLTSLKTDVSDINEKMDALIRAMNRVDTNQRTPATAENTHASNNPPPAQMAQPSNHTQLPTHPQAAPATAGPNQPAQHRTYQDPRNVSISQCPYPNVQNPLYTSARQPSTHMSPEAFIQRELERDSFYYPDAGKPTIHSDIRVSRAIMKPYMFLYREGISTTKQKLDVRHTMTAGEYTDAMLTLLSDRRAFDPKDFNDIFLHLRKVTRDALERPWPSVRRWTQYIWDTIEEGSITWADTEFIQEERVRMCLTSNTTQLATNTYQIPARRNQGLQEVPCRAFNTRAGCQHRDSHVDGSIYSLHICTYCDSVGKACYHSVRECERRVTHSRNDNTHLQPRGRPYSQPQQFQHANGYQQNQFNNAMPKNGF